MRKAGLLTVTDGTIAQTQADTVPEGGRAILDVTVPDAGGDILARARQALTGVEGIDKVIEPGEYARDHDCPVTATKNGGNVLTRRQIVAVSDRNDIFRDRAIGPFRAMRRSRGTMAHAAWPHRLRTREAPDTAYRRDTAAKVRLLTEAFDEEMDVVRHELRRVDRRRDGPRSGAHPS